MQAKLTTQHITSSLGNFTNGCPYCNSLIWVKLHRKWWHKITHYRENLCFCRDCRKEFWRPIIEL